MGDVKLSGPPPPPPPPDMASEQKLYMLNALQVVDKWSVHDDGDGRLFYYDCKTDSSQWEVPEGLASLEMEFMMKLMLQNAVARSGIWTAHDTGNGTLYYFNSKTRESVWERPSDWGVAEAGVTEEREKEQMAEIAKKLKEEKKEKVVKKEKKKHKKKHKDKRDEEVQQKEDEEEEVPLTEEELQAEVERKECEQKRIEQFRVMLRDKNIMPFCKWSVALPQIAGDPRFVGVPTMDERRAIFEHFVEHRREDLKAEKKNKLKQAKQLFTQLLHEQFQLDSWEPSITLSVFLSTLEGQIDSKRYKQLQNDALVLLTLSAQEKIYTKAVAEYKSESLKRDGEQLRLSKFLENKLSTLDKAAMRWESDDVQKHVREFYNSAASNGESGALLSKEKQRMVFEELISGLARSCASTQEDEDQKKPERSNLRPPSREHAQSNDHRRSDSSPRRELRRSHGDRSQSRSRHRRSRSDSRSHSVGRHCSRRSSRRRSVSSSRSRSRERRSSRRSPHHRRHSSTSSRSRSRPRK